MSDFLDRVAARVIGIESALVPRLPSLFESPRQLPTLPDVEQGEAPAHHRSARSGVVSAPSAVPASSVSSVTASKPERTRAAPVERAAVSTAPAAAPACSWREASLPASTAPLQPPALERPAAATPVRQRKEDAPAPVQPRQTRVTPDRQESTSPPPGGSLLSSPVPVFATRAPAASSPLRSAHATTRPRLAARADSRGEAVRDAVVQVSIGRLEVRAAAVPVAAPRRHDAPRASSLDDYLRQRGDKVVP
ncbi:MAG: hypothetical protein ABI128_10195 [Rhodanobacter sp.]